MPTLTDTAICIRRWDFSETSQTVSLFTREHGIIRGIAKGAKRERGMFSGGFDVLTRGQVVAIVRPGRDLATLTAWNLEETYRVLRHCLAANRAAMFMADLVHHMLTQQDPHPVLFDTFAAGLAGLAESGAEPDADRATRATMLRLQWALLVETGYRPELNRDVETGAAIAPDAATLVFSPRAGGLVGGDGPDRWRVRRATIELLHRVADGEVVDDAAPEVVERANRLLATYLREIIGAELPTMRWAQLE